MATALLLSACGANPYGFSRSYVVNDDEKIYDQQSRSYTYGAVTAKPHDYIDQTIAWFGIVEEIQPTRDGRYLIRLAHHKHKERHLCNGETESTCRVTVNTGSSGGFSTVIELTPEDILPNVDKLRKGSLLRVFGKVNCKENDAEEMICDRDEKGGILFEGVFYRHWPPRYYVTTRAAGQMRR